MQDPNSPRSRWIQFGLRTMFVAVTVFAVFLSIVGYHINWIRQRHAYQARLSARYELLELNVRFFNVNTDRTLPWGLSLLGEKGASQVFPFFDVDVDEGPDREAALKEIEEAERLFPEAIVKPMVKLPGWHAGVREFRK